MTMTKIATGVYFLLSLRVLFFIEVATTPLEYLFD